MPSNPQLAGYGAIPIVNESNINSKPFDESTESWVLANVTVAGKLVEGKEEMTLRGEATGAGEAVEVREAVEVGEAMEAGEREDYAQPVQPVYRDKWFGVAFIAHLITFIAIGVSYGLSSSQSPLAESEEDSNSSENEINLPWRTLTIGGIAVSYLTTYAIVAFIIPKFSTFAVTASLYGSLIVNILLALAFIIYVPSVIVIIIAVAVVVFNIWYVRQLKDFVPFAAANLKLAAQAVSANSGVYPISFLVGFIGVVWMGFWSYTANALGLFDENVALNDDDYYGDVAGVETGIKGFLLLVSLYWTLSVLGNIIQTTTAGVTGTWCFDKNSASSSCSSAVVQSLYRSCTYSFGSICFGSLLNAIITALRVMTQQAQENSINNDQDGAALLYCCLTCILSLLEDIIEYFNQWAFIFVGIWGLDYLESGKRVLELFQARGVTSIISNGLANYVLTNVVIFTSLMGGLFGYIVAHDWVAFWICFVIGLIVSIMMVNIVQSSVKAVIVCYADHPHKLYENHPEGTNELTIGISQVDRSIPLPVFNNTTAFNDTTASKNTTV